MKKNLCSFALVILFCACNSDGSINEQKIDAAGDKLQKTVEKTTDSIGEKVERFVDSLDRRDDTLR